MRTCGNANGTDTKTTVESLHIGQRNSETHVTHPHSVAGSGASDSLPSRIRVNCGCRDGTIREAVGVQGEGCGSAPNKKPVESPSCGATKVS